MKEQLLQLKAKYLELSAKLSLTQKISIVAVLVMMFATILYLSVNANKVDYSTLMSNLTAEDSSEIVEYLKKEKIPYSIAAGGGAIRVPEDKVLDLRLQVAGNGLLKGGGVGYELFDKQDITTLTEFTENLNMVRATQGELARTIQSLAPVKSARVHIAMPKDSLFIEDKREPSASILINLHPGRALSERQVASIVHLVSSSVIGLTPDRITLVDNFGNVLNSGDGGGIDGITGKNLAFKQKVDKGLEENIMRLLLPIVGEGKARVSVNTDLDFDQAEKNEERYDPNVTAVRSETKLEEQKENLKPQNAGGLVGTQANLPGRAGQATTNSAEGSKSSVEKSTTNYEINKTIRKVQEAVGNVKKVSVSVLLDGVTKKNGDKVEMAPMPDDQVKRIDEIVRTAVGFDEKRGDRVVVSSIPFAEVEVEPAVPAYKEIITFAVKHNIIPWILLFITIIVALILLSRSIKALAPASVTPEGIVLEGQSMRDGSGDFSKSETIAEVKQKTAEEIELERLSAEIEESMGITMSKEQLTVINFARKNVDITARILRKWMKEK